GNLEAMKKYGTVTVDKNGVITNFEEKPDKPKSTLAAVALYYYSREVLPLFTTYLAAGNNPDQPGLFLQWLYTRKPVNTFEIKGRWLDIGSKETLAEADKISQVAAIDLFDPAFVELDQIKIGPDIFASRATGLF